MRVDDLFRPGEVVVLRFGGSWSPPEVAGLEWSLGTIIVTNERILFRPGLWSRALSFGTDPTIELSRSEVAAIDGDRTRWWGGLRITMSDGSAIVFGSIHRPHERAEQLRLELGMPA